MTICSDTLEVFDNVTENKLIYTTIFQQYTTLIGKHQRLAGSPFVLMVSLFHCRILSGAALAGEDRGILISFAYELRWF